MTYLNITEVESALVALSTAYPGTCELITLPNASHEGRTSRAVRIGLGALDGRPGIFFVGGQHAREWGSCEICVNVATDLLAAYAAGSGLTYGGQSFSAATVRRIVEDAQVFIYPLVNPDGRQFSQNHDPDWRKNRNPGGAVDLNRNFDFLWDFNTALHPDSHPVVSDLPTSDQYHGPAPFSEPESRNVKWLLDSYPQIRWAVDIHSYSQLLYHVWGDDQNQATEPSKNFTNAAFDGERGIEDDAYGAYILSDDLGTQCGLVQRMQDALRNVRGITYQTGQTFEVYDRPVTGTLTSYFYSRHIADPALTKTHGFLIEWGTEFQPAWAEMENIIVDVSSALVAFADRALDECGILDVTLETPSLQFHDVPEGETTFRAVTFRVTACCDVDFEIVSGPEVVSGPAGTDFDTPLGTSDTAPAAAPGFSFARLWVSYRGTAAGDTADGTVTVRCRNTRQEWVVPITTNVIERPTAALLMVLDRSNSMSFDSGIGPGISRGDVLKFSAPSVVDVIENDNALGILGFYHDPDPIMPITDMDPGSRIIANGHLAGYEHNPAGWTSIGEAVAEARSQLSAPGITQTVKAMVVLTDGREEHDGYDRRFISDVAGEIDSRVYAIGLGTPGALRPAALQALCDDRDGYMMITGALDADALFRLTKYYQQILAGVTNNEIVVDPEGAIRPGQKHIVPFRLCETDISADAILMSPAPYAIRYTLVTPGGETIDAGVATASPAIELGGGSQIRFYRMTLPVALGGAKNHEGIWKAVLEVEKDYFERYLSDLKKKRPELHDRVAAHGVRYGVMCRTWSNLRFSVRAGQTSREPGGELALRARLSEFGVPVEGRAAVTAEVEMPDGATTLLGFTEMSDGMHEARITLAQPGVARCRVVANGRTLRGTPFTREQTVTGAAWAGGDDTPPTSRPGGAGAGTHDALCCLLTCLVDSDGGQRVLKKLEIDPDEMRRCLKSCCGSGEAEPEKTGEAVKTGDFQAFKR